MAEERLSAKGGRLGEIKMTQTEKRVYLIKSLLKERPQYTGIPIPVNEQEQKNLLRSLLNLRMPDPISEDFLTIQDAYLQEELAQKGITELAALRPVQNQIYLWRGDITTLACDAIVNAANAQLLGCFCPCHGCIDNAIHTFSGVQLRLACDKLMRQTGELEATGSAKITPAFNLPCRYVLHTVGPIVDGDLTAEHEMQLSSCYRSCLALAAQNQIQSLAFCCISTGEFRFPNQRAAEIAIETTKAYLKETQSELKVIFNVFKERDYKIYKKRLCTDRRSAKHT